LTWVILKESNYVSSSVLDYPAKCGSVSINLERNH
jgi:hypothetical protein